MKKITEYNEDSIEGLEGLQAVRVRPSMYIGDLTVGQFQIAKEALDNALDEALAGFSKKVYCIKMMSKREIYEQCLDVDKPKIICVFII